MGQNRLLQISRHCIPRRYKVLDASEGKRKRQSGAVSSLNSKPEHTVTDKSLNKHTFVNYLTGNLLSRNMTLH